MEWKQFYHLQTDSNEWRLILDTITMDEATVAATIKALMAIPQPTDLYWALVGAVSELGDIKRRAYAEAAEKARKSQRWEDAKWSTDFNGFETSGSAKGDASFFGGGGMGSGGKERARPQYGQADLDEMIRRMKERMEAQMNGAYHGAFFGFDPGREHKHEAPKAKTNYTGRDWWVVIGCSKTADRATIKGAYRKRAMEIHQNALGEDALKELNVAKDMAFKLVLS